MAYKSLSSGRPEVRLITIVTVSDDTGVEFNLQDQEASNLTDLIRSRLEHVEFESPKSSQAWKSSRADESHSPLNWEDPDGSPADEDAPNWRYSWGDYVALS